MNAILISIVFMLAVTTTSAQKNDLEQARLKNCGKNCASYTANKKWVKQLYELPPQGPEEIDKRPNRLKRLFRIPLEDRIKLFPFSEYDSIFIVTPDTIKGVEEPRDYLLEKYTKSKRLITKSEVKKLSNILFNYYQMTYSLKACLRAKTGCDCLAADYPRILILFFKHGKNERFIGFPDDCYHRTNLTDDEYIQLDLSEEKSKLILNLFKSMQTDQKLLQRD